MDLRGLLFFPVTPFHSDLTVDVDALARHVENRMHPQVGAVFAACGTGEFHSLSAAEVGLVAATAVGVAAGAVPVFAGVGGPLGHAIACADNALAAGVDGLLVFAPYVLDPTAGGIGAYISALASRTPLPLICYNRPEARLDVHTVRSLLVWPNIVAIKDGVGDLDLMAAVGSTNTATDRTLGLFNGMPLAELHDQRYRAMGIGVYSSSTYCMAPNIALAFRDAADGGDETRCELFRREFFEPLDRLRRRRPGLIVPLVKAGLIIRGCDAGPMRPPLVALEDSECDLLAELLDRGERVVGS